MKRANVRKLILVNAKAFVAFALILWYVIFMGTERELTWIELVAIPVACSLLVLGLLNVAIFVGRKRSGQGQQDSESTKD